MIWDPCIVELVQYVYSLSNAKTKIQQIKHNKKLCAHVMENSVAEHREYSKQVSRVFNISIVQILTGDKRQDIEHQFIQAIWSGLYEVWWPISDIVLINLILRVSCSMLLQTHSLLMCSNMEFCQRQCYHPWSTFFTFLFSSFQELQIWHRH